MNKNIIALGFVSFFTDMASAMIAPLIPILVVYLLKNDVQTLGYIVAIATFVSYFLRLFFGYLGDKFQITKPLVVTGYLISAITKPLFYFVSSWPQVAVIQSTERMGKAIRSASKDSLISAFAKKKQSGKTFGFHKTMDIAGELTGSILIFILLMIYGQDEKVIKSIFIATALPGLIAVIIITFFVEDAPYKRKSKKYQWEASDNKLLPLLFIYFGFVFFVFSNSFYVIKATELGYKVAYIPLLFILLNLTQTLSSYYIGLKIDDLGFKRVLIIGYVFGVLTQASLYFNSIWLSFILLGLFTVTTLNAIRSAISQQAKNKATVYGIFYAGTALFGALGALLIGFLWHHYSETTAIIFSIVGVILMLIIQYILGKGIN